MDERSLRFFTKLDERCLLRQFALFLHSATDRPMDRPTNRVTYRIACMRLKIGLTFQTWQTCHLWTIWSPKWRPNYSRMYFIAQVEVGLTHSEKNLPCHKLSKYHWFLGNGPNRDTAGMSIPPGPKSKTSQRASQPRLPASQPATLFLAYFVNGHMGCL